MFKRTVFTTITPLPASISRQCVMGTLRSHTEMIDLNPLVEKHHPIKPPANATAEEFHCAWYSLTGRVQYLPGELLSGKANYNACFHDLQNGLQTHYYAPMGLTIKGKWTLGGCLPGEPITPVELGVNAPLRGLYLREDVDMSCNFMMTSFVKKALKKGHAALVAHLQSKAQTTGALGQGFALNQSNASPYSPAPHSEYEFPRHKPQSVFGTPEQFQSGTFRSSPLPSGAISRDRARINPPLHSPALSARSMSGSYGNSRPPSQRGSLSSRNSVRDGEAAGPRNLWQALNTPKRSPEIMNQGFTSSPLQETAEMMDTHREQVPQQPVYNPATFPSEFGPVEMAAPLR